MAFCRLPLILVVLSVVQCFASVQVPVFLWGDLPETPRLSSPLMKTSFAEFTTLMKEELEDEPFMVTYIEETLSVEDFALKDADGQTLFPYLHTMIDSALYLPSVENPVRVLNKIADPDKVDHIKLTENGLSADIEPESGKFLFINLKDAVEGESRAEMLARHNDFMAKMFTDLKKKHKYVLAVYTGHNSSWTVSDSHSRVRRQAEQIKIVDAELEGLRIYFSNVELDDGTKAVNLTYTGPGNSVINGTNAQSNTLMFNDNNITLNFNINMGYWMLESVTVESAAVGSEEIPAANDVYALMDHSYRCGVNVSFAPVNATRAYKVTFQDFKVQPYFTTNSSGLEWGDSFNCVGFFSAPIWAGLFVTALLLIITFYGIMMMMDIKTMDRFDDPKGKTININSME